MKVGREPDVRIVKGCEFLLPIYAPDDWCDYPPQIEPLEHAGTRDVPSWLGAVMTGSSKVAIIGAGPYGYRSPLICACGIELRIFGSSTAQLAGPVPCIKAA